MRIFKQNKLILLPLLLIVSCGSSNISNDSHFSSSQSSITPSTSNSSSESSISSQFTTSATDSSSMYIKEPGIYLPRTRIGVAKSKTVMIQHEVYPSDLGEVTWQLIANPSYGSAENQPAIVTPNGEVTGVRYIGEDELLIKGTLLQYEVYVTLMVFLDYDELVDTFYPSHEITSAIGYGYRYHNGTTVYARHSAYRHTHYYAYDLKAGMTFNVMGKVRYNADKPKFYYEFGRAVNKKFVVMESPFISDDGNAMLLGYDILEDGEYMLRVKPHIEINSSSDEFSYILYTFWF